MTELQSYLTLSEAARKYGVSRDASTQLVRDGIIRAVHNEEGTAVITVQTVDNATAAKIIQDEIKPEQYEHLRGRRIRLMEAVRKYEVSDPSLINWTNRGYIDVHKRGFQHLELDEADVAYVTAIYKRGRELTGSPIKAGWIIKRILDSSLDKA